MEREPEPELGPRLVQEQEQELEQEPEPVPVRELVPVLVPASQWPEEALLASSHGHQSHEPERQPFSRTSQHHRARHPKTHTRGVSRPGVPASQPAGSLW